ncbi:MAG: LysR family transcriptional regulator [Granulosicoccus sp.]
MPFTLKQIRYFVAVAENGTVAGASKELSISQSTVTEAIKALEEQLDVLLFKRRRRGLEATHQGHVFLRHARTILAETANAEASIASSKPEIPGNLNLGVTSLTAGYVLPDILSRFRRAWPGIQVNAVEDSGEYLEHLLVGGELDVAMMVVTHLNNPQALHTEILAVSPYRLWLPSAHALCKAESISLADLASEPQIILDIDEMQLPGQRLLTAFGNRPRVAFRTRSVEAVRSLVASGEGIALLPDLVYRPWSLDGDRIESRDVSADLPLVQFGLAWRRGMTRSNATRAFLEVAQSQPTSRH